MNARKALDSASDLLNSAIDAEVEEVEKTLEKLENWSERMDSVNEQIGALLGEISSEGNGTKRNEKDKTKPRVRPQRKAALATRDQMSKLARQLQ